MNSILQSWYDMWGDMFIVGTVAIGVMLNVCCVLMGVLAMNLFGILGIAGIVLSIGSGMARDVNEFIRYNKCVYGITVTNILLSGLMIVSNPERTQLIYLAGQGH